MKLSNNPKTSVDVNAIAFGELKGIQNYIRERETKDSDFGLFVLKQISAFTDNPTEFNIPDETDVPDGQPIGGLINYLQGCSN